MRHYGYRSVRGPFADLQDALSDLVDQVTEFTFGFGGERGFPRYEVSRDDAGYRVRVEVPGLSREEIDVTVAARTLTVSGDRKSVEPPEGARMLRDERPTGPFERTIELPEEIDTQGVVAKLESGVLEVTLPSRSKARGRRIEVELAD